MKQLHLLVTSQLGTRGKCEVNTNSSCVPSNSASTAFSGELPAVQSICSASVKTTVYMKEGANFNTQLAEVITFVEERKDTVESEQSPKTRSRTSKAPDSHLSGNFHTTLRNVRSSKPVGQ